MAWIKKLKSFPLILFDCAEILPFAKIQKEISLKRTLSNVTELVKENGGKVIEKTEHKGSFHRICY